MRAAFVHVLGDALGSVGAIVAGVAILLAGWYVADPLVSVGIGLLILYSSWEIITESVDILMQGTPRAMRLEDIEQCLLDIKGVRQFHDLHVWALTSGKYHVSVHFVSVERMRLTRSSTPRRASFVSASGSATAPYRSTGRWNAPRSFMPIEGSAKAPIFIRHIDAARRSWLHR